MALIPKAGPPVLLIQDFEMHNADITAWAADRVSYALADDPVEATIDLLNERGLSQSHLGIEASRPILSTAIPIFRPHGRCT